MARQAPAPPRDAPGSLRQPFAEDMSGADYFRTDQHYRFLARAIAQHLSEMRGFVLVTGEPPADGQAVELLLCHENRRAILLSCRPDMKFADLVQAYAAEVGLRVADADSAPWSLMSHLMGEARRGAAHVLVLDKPELLDTATLNELFGLLRLDEPYVTPVVLLASPSFPARFDEPPLDAHAALLVARLPLQHLEREEIADFIRRQLAAAGNRDAALFTPEIIDTIAQAANGNPLVVNRLARSVLISSRESEAESATADIPIDIPVPRPPQEIVASPSAGGATATPLDRGDPLPRWLVPDREEPSPPTASAQPSAARSDRLDAARRRPRLALPSPLRMVAVATIGAAIVSLPLSIIGSIVDFGIDRWRHMPSPAAVFAPLPPAETDAKPDGPAAEAEGIPAERAPQIEERQSTDLSNQGETAERHETTSAVDLSPGEANEATAEPSTTAASPPPPVAATAPSAPEQGLLSPAEIKTIVQRGQQLLIAGDVLSARQFFEMAVSQDEDKAALGLGKSYDPFFLRRLGAHGPAADSAKAEMWYRKAADRGNLEALARLERLRADSSRR